mgnify:FL=1
MTVQTTFLPREEFIASKPLEERIAHVKANPQMYAPKPQYDLIKTVLNKIEALDSKMNQILAKK